MKTGWIKIAKKQGQPEPLLRMAVPAFSPARTFCAGIITGMILILTICITSYPNRATAADEKEPPVNPSELHETPVGDMVADAMRAATGADVALINAGSLGFEDLPKSVTEDNVSAFIPFGSDNVVVIKLKGADLLAALERSVSVLPRRFSGFLQVSGLKITVDPAKNKGGRIKSAEVNGESLDPKASYTVAVTDFLAGGGAGYLPLKKGAPVSEQALALDAILIANSGPLDADNVGGRIIAAPSEKDE